MFGKESIQQRKKQRGGQSVPCLVTYSPLLDFASPAALQGGTLILLWCIYLYGAGSYSQSNESFCFIQTFTDMLQFKECANLFLYATVKIMWVNEKCLDCFQASSQSYFLYELFILHKANFSLTFCLVFNLVKHPFNGELFCNIKNISSAEDQVGIKAYRRIAGKRTGFNYVSSHLN